MGTPQLTIDLEDRRPALLAILRSVLVTYSSLLGSLLEPPNTMSTATLQPEWQRYVEWITVLSQNLMAAANDLRPMQARPLPLLSNEMTVNDPHFSGTGELGNDDDEATRITARGNEAIACVRTHLSNV